MKVEEYSGQQEREILLGMITSPYVLGRIAAHWKTGGMFVNSEVERVAEWCVTHYRQHQQPPDKGIMAYYSEWAEAAYEPATVKLTEKLLTSLSEDVEKGAAINPEHLVEVAARRFTRNRLDKLADDIKAAVKAGKVDRAATLVNSFDRVEMEASAGVALFNDEEAVRSTYAKETSESLFTFPDALGNFFSNSLIRQGFLSFCGPQKAGKSFWLARTAWQAVCQRRRVAYFQVGDMDEEEVKDRLLCLHSRRPSVSQDEQWPTTIRIPTSLRVAWDQDPQIEFVEKTFKRKLNGDKAWEACQTFMQTKVRSRREFFRLFAYPTTTVAGIKEALELAERLHNWVPEVVVIDYADNLEAPIEARKEVQRDQINAKWKALRVLALERKCLIITATQVKAEAFKARIITREHFAEDNRKLNHVTGMIGINVTPKEKELDACRLNWVIKRRGAYSPYLCWTAAGCRAISDPVILSAPPPTKGEG